MVIRCERCSTLYDLDESLLSPSGSQVQCTRCQHLFTAFPPSAESRALAAAPARVDGAPSSPPAGPAPSAAPAAPALPKARSAPGSTRTSPAQGGKPEPKPVRTAPAPVYRPAPPAPGAASSPGVPRAPMLRRDAVGAFEARLRRTARMRWLAPGIAAAAIAALAAGWFLLSRRGGADAGSTRARTEALATAALDDTASLDRAIARLEDLERRARSLRGVTADRALVQVLRAGALADEGEALSARLASRSSERERLRREQPAGWEEAERAAAAEVQALEPEVRAREERSRALAAAALESLRRVEAEAGGSPEVARGLAAYHALAGGRERVEAAVRTTRGAAGDPWIDLAAAWLDARNPDRATRERSLSSLRALATAHPEILRARLLLARTQASVGRHAEAIATLDALLLANAHHEAARRLRDELSTPAPPAAVAASAEAPPGKVATQPRKRVSPPAQPASAPPAQADAGGVPESPSAPPGPTEAPAESAAPRTTPAAAPRATPEVDAGSAGGAGAGRDAMPAPRPSPRPAPSPDPDELRPLDGG